MLFFAAGNFPMMQDPVAETAMAVRMLKRFGVYCRLVSFYYKEKAETVMQLKQGDFAEQVILTVDSGAYTAYTQGKVIDIDEYIDFLQQNIGSIDHYVNLDVIGDGPASYANYRYMTRAGLNPIPVWHLETEKEYLLAYLDQADFVGISLPKSKDPKKKAPNPKKQIPELDDLWLYPLTDQDGFPKAKFHLFGVASLPVIKRYPWWSFDSTSWVETAKFGGIYLPKAPNGIPSFNQIPSSVPVSNRSSDKDNHLLNLNRSKQKYAKARITSAELQFELNHNLDDQYTRYAINMAHFYNVAAIQPRWPWRFTREQIRYG